MARRLLGPHIGFYGGINYGFGYIGIGFVGGYWNHDRYFYNRAVTNVNVTHITNVYTHNVVVNNIDNRRISYNGGPNGIRRMADPREAAARNEAHIPPTAAQRNFARSAGADRGQFFEHNQGRPPRLHGARPRPGAGSRPDGALSPGAGPRGDRHNDSGLRSTSTAPRPTRTPAAPARARTSAPRRRRAARRSLLARRSRRRRRFANRPRSPACSGRNAVPTIWRSPCTTNGSAARRWKRPRAAGQRAAGHRPAPPQRHEERGGDRPERGGGDRGGGNRGGGGGHGRD